ncbi:FtsB family cell division protein [Actinotalea subterranea]|uniref:FtsB family cell division protein n=1 Tax=Actinotalea subterranea TaxID=2607497 RepID=UPI0011ED207D|nr:septum formation initiator family protein [Actinotalea subterranea]
MSRRPVPPRSRAAASGGAAQGQARVGADRPAPRRGAARPAVATPSARPTDRTDRTSRARGPATTAPGRARAAGRQGRAARAAQSRDERPGRAGQLARLLSVRALVLSVVALVGFTMLFPTVRAYLGQRAELDALAAQVAHAEQVEADLQAELTRWDDPAYVAAQARDRLAYVRPGETSYRVIEDVVVEEQVLPDASAGGVVAGPALPAGGALRPWYATVWESIEVAGQAPVPTQDETDDQVGGPTGE